MRIKWILAVGALTIISAVAVFGVLAPPPARDRLEGPAQPAAIPARDRLEINAQARAPDLSVPPTRDRFDVGVDLLAVAEFRNFLGTVNGNEIICRALGSLFEVPASAACAGRVFNEKRTVFYQITTYDSVGKVYEFELLGESPELALKVPGWVERHRFYIVMGFDGDLRPNFTVFNFEAMLRTTPELLPIHDDLFEYIRRDNDSLLRAFQERIKDTISNSIKTAFAGQRVGMK